MMRTFIICVLIVLLSSTCFAKRGGNGGGGSDKPQKVFDRDGDGYNHRVDCDDRDINIYPGAYEILYNGIDENCNGLADDSIPEMELVTFHLQWDPSPTPDVDGYKIVNDGTVHDAGNVLDYWVTIDKPIGQQECFYAKTYKGVAESPPSETVCGE